MSRTLIRSGNVFEQLMKVVRVGVAGYHDSPNYDPREMTWRVGGDSAEDKSPSALEIFPAVYSKLPSDGANCDKRISSFNRVLSTLSSATDQLLRDGFHAFDTNNPLSGSIGRFVRYHGAYLGIEKAIIGKEVKRNASCCDGGVDICCIESTNKGAEGIAVIAMLPDGFPVGRMFIANTAYDTHLTFVNIDHTASYDQNLDIGIMIASMIKAVIDDRGLTEEQKSNLKSREIRTSCVASYAGYVERVAGYNEEIFPTKNDEDKLDKSMEMQFSFSSLYASAIGFLEKKGVLSKNPSPKILSASQVAEADKTNQSTL